MRVQSIHINKWHHFENIHLEIPDGAPVICLVGSNGSGKSHILELIALCAHHIGLSPGHESTRTNVQAGDDISVTFCIAEGVFPEVETGIAEQSAKTRFEKWDRTLTVSLEKNGSLAVRAGGLVDASLSGQIVQFIQASKDTHYLFLDADRAYPKIDVHAHQIGSIFDRDWVASNKSSSFKISRNLYEEWFQYFIGLENQSNNSFVRNIRLARSKSEAEPAFEDQFDSYKDALKKVLPHLLFTGVDTKKKQVLFDSSGVPLYFSDLSGGEREIAFLVGQIDRFSLTRGLLLVDEPELHLNYDLLRTWIGFLKDSVTKGQVWLATHSLEVVEVAGQEATFLFERDASTRRVNSAAPLTSKPVVSVLSRAIGSPAFSMGSLAFVFIEGEEALGERERFRQLCNTPAHVRFMEGRSCSEVIRRISEVRTLADESGQPIRLGGIVDRDWRQKPELNEISKTGVFVLEVHEVENFYLHPATLGALSRKLGHTLNMNELVRDAADQRAGVWVFQAARTMREFSELPEPSKACRELANKMKWSSFADVDAASEQLAKAHDGLSPDQEKKLIAHLRTQATIYGRLRDGDDLWRRCEGKQVFKAITSALGLASADVAERAIRALWTDHPEFVPPELANMRHYVASL